MMDELSYIAEGLRGLAVSIDEVHEDPANARKGHAIDRIAASLKTYGQRKPIVVNRAQSGKVEAGNGTLRAAKQLGWSHIAVVWVEDDATTATGYGIADNRLGEMSEWDVDVLAGMSDIGDMLTGFEPGELDALLAATVPVHTIGRGGRLYNNRDIEPFKLAHRVEAAWQASGELALDLFAGAGQLAAWYRRRFVRVVTVDRKYQVGDVDYSMTALQFIARHLPEFMDFTFVDFDDEGTPAAEIQAFFAAIAGRRSDPFILCLTDGNGLNMKAHGYVDFAKTYLVANGQKRRATSADFADFDAIVTSFVNECAHRHGFTAVMISGYRGRSDNVVFQTWRISPSDAAAHSPG